MKNLLLSNVFIFILLFTFPVDVQTQSFIAVTNAEEILEGYDFQVTFTLEGAKGTSFQPPPFKNFTVVGGPSTSSSLSIINGRTTQSVSFTYGLMPKITGQQDIGTASIKVGGNTLRTKPLSIKVLKRSENKSDTDDVPDVYMELEIGDTAAYVGQQIILKYVIYTSIDVRSYNFINETEYKGFYVEEIQNYRVKGVQIVQNGKQYIKQTLKTVALFPQQTGRAEIGPALVNLGIAVKSNRPSFFFSTSMKSQRLTTPAKKIRVLSTPVGAPYSFSGGIGNFIMSASIDRNTVPEDGAVSMKMRIDGDGDAKFLGPPKQSFEGFEIYEPNLLTESNVMNEGRIKFTKIYEYLLLPQKRGAHLIAPEFSYYNVDSAKYLTIYGPKFSVKVLPGNNNTVISTEDLSSRMLPIATATTLFKPINPIFSYWHIGILSSIALGFIAIGGVKWNNNRIAAIDPKLLKSQKAKKVATLKLATAKNQLDIGNIKEFYKSLSDSLFSYIADKLDISPNSISKDNLSELFSFTEVSSEVVETLGDMIKRSEMAIYAGFSPDEAMSDYDASIVMVAEIEKAL
ncbi:MAG: BatD family protein [Saprospiraceae bacterium]